MAIARHCERHDQATWGGSFTIPTNLYKKTLQAAKQKQAKTNPFDVPGLPDVSKYKPQTGEEATYRTIPVGFRKTQAPQKTKTYRVHGSQGSIRFHTIAMVQQDCLDQTIP